MQEISSHFNDQNYLQTCGTAIGTKMAVALGNIFTAKIEIEILDKGAKKPFVWKRYINDISLLHTNRHVGNPSIEQANKFYPIIKITAEISVLEATFLDTIIYKGERFNR